MRRSFFPLILAALLLIIMPLGAGAAVEVADASVGRAQGTGIYVVRQGDTLYRIAARHCMSSSELYSLNSSILSNPNQIYTGMQLRVINRCGDGSPGGGNWGSVCDRGPSQHAQGTVWGNRYHVVRGDTSYSIAARFGISVTALCQANGINPWHIFAGQTLIIPGLTGSCGQCAPGNWNCPPNNCWNCPPSNCWNCPPANCVPGWNCPVTPVPRPTVVPVTPVPQARIQVDVPTPGATLPPTFTVSGSGQGLFEGNVVVNAQTAAGAPLGQQVTILQGPNVGAGGPGTFSVQLTVSVPGPTPGHIVVSSPQSPVAPVYIPVTFTAGGAGGGITYHEYSGNQCRVTVPAGAPFHGQVGGPQLGAIPGGGTFIATRGARDGSQNNQLWFFITDVPANPPAVWVPLTAVSWLAQPCFW